MTYLQFTQLLANHDAPSNPHREQQLFDMFIREFIINNYYLTLHTGIMLFNNNIIAKIKTKSGVEVFEVCDAVNNASQLKRYFDDVRKKFTQSSSIINII